MNRHINWLFKETFKEIGIRLGGLDRSSTGQFPLGSIDPIPMDFFGSRARSDRLNSWRHFFCALLRNSFTRLREEGVIK